MAYEAASEYVFHEVQESIFSRKCYGFEELVSNMEEYCDGFVHLTATAAVSLPFSTTFPQLEKYVKAAWVAYRHFIPAIACKTYRLSDGDRRFAFRYEVPRTQKDVEAWLEETIFLSDKNKDETLYEKHRKLKDDHWWRCSDDHYVLELHISPVGLDWAFNFVFVHNIVDGRSSYEMMDLFLGFLGREIANESVGPLPQWGTEVPRLPLPGAFAAALATSGSPPDVKDPELLRMTNGTNEHVVTHWNYATRATGLVGDASRLVQLSEDVSAELHVLCRQRGFTITHVITALTILAHTETALKMAAVDSVERFDEVARAYNAASHYLVPWNFINQRRKFPGGYNSYYSATGASTCTADCVPLSFPMDGIRSCVKVVKKQAAIRVIDSETFWDVLVRDVAVTWKELDQTLDGYVSRENALHHAFHSFTPQIFDLPALIVSSIGDLGRLDILSQFVPSTATGPKLEGRLVVNEVICGIRIRTPPIMNLFWEYRGRMTFHFMAGGEYTTDSALEMMTRIFEDWTRALVRKPRKSNEADSPRAS